LVVNAGGVQRLRDYRSSSYRGLVLYERQLAAVAHRLACHGDGPAAACGSPWSLSLERSGFDFDVAAVSDFEPVLVF